MNQYKEMLKRLADADSPEIIRNSSTDHAAAVIAEMFARAKDCIYILTGRANPLIYGRDGIVQAAASFLKRGGTLTFIAEQCRDDADARTILGDEGGFFAQTRALLDPESAARVQFRHGSDALSKNVPIHFMVVDRKAFRVEPDKGTHEAFASFNQPSVAGALSDMFKAFVGAGNDWTHVVPTRQ